MFLSNLHQSNGGGSRVAAFSMVRCLMTDADYAYLHMQAGRNTMLGMHREDESSSDAVVDSSSTPQITEALVLTLYDDLRRLAHFCMRNERSGHTLQTSALVHEAYLRLLRSENMAGATRESILSLASALMRQILVDHARKVRASKRGGGLVRVDLPETLAGPDRHGPDVLALHDALERLAVLDPRKARVVEMRYFGGLDVQEIAECLSVTRRTVTRDWDFARAWLRRQLGPRED